MGGNRTGKTYCGAYERYVHQTGLYPPWWTGKRFDKPVVCWAAGDSGKVVRDTMQLKLLGPRGHFGTGMIPRSLLIATTPKSGISNAVDTIYVQHKSGGQSQITMKSYDQGREAFESAEVADIWLDEEPPEDIYVECLMRTMTVSGQVSVTFTPMKGMSKLIMDFMGVAHG